MILPSLGNDPGGTNRTRPRTFVTDCSVWARASPRTCAAPRFPPTASSRPVHRHVHRRGSSDASLPTPTP